MKRLLTTIVATMFAAVSLAAIAQDKKEAKPQVSTKAGEAVTTKKGEPIATKKQKEKAPASARAPKVKGEAKKKERLPKTAPQTKSGEPVGSKPVKPKK